MAKEKKKKAKSESLPDLETKPWIQMKTGLTLITITSIVMAVLTAIQAAPVKGWAEGIMWGVIFGALIWVIFFGLVFINRFLRR
jgi:uncharacterized membrane-anchored protein YitT (DUF2179 family)